MKLVVISPESDDAREPAVLRDLFAAGLERYHVRKPGWSRDQIAAWLRAFPAEQRARMLLHSHHELVDELGLAGRHWRDDGTAPARPVRDGKLASRSCHTLASVLHSFGAYDAVFYGPVFPSLSKPGRGPQHLQDPPALITAFAAGAVRVPRQTSVFALGGVTAETAPRAVALGFDGVAVLGAIWQAADPLRAFTALQKSLLCHAA